MASIALRTRHIAILSYAAIVTMAIFEHILSTPETLTAALAPLAGMFVWDKLKGTP